MKRRRTISSGLVRQVNIHAVRREDPAYSALIGRGILRTALADLEELQPRRRLFVVTDAHVEAAGHLAALVEDRPVGRYVIQPPGESSKNMKTVIAILDAMERQKFGRDSVLVALGGGTVGDIGGFAAGIFKRGIPCAQVPTTTVAQADSSVGGKVGVDSALSKNAYGLFQQPARVYVDVATLATMDERAYRAGLVESVKHALIADRGVFRVPRSEPGKTARPGRGGARGDRRAQHHDQGADRRARPGREEPRGGCLNYGHTVGHAIESASGFRLLHGEAVALGILAAARIAEEMGLADGTAGRRAAALLRGTRHAGEAPAGHLRRPARRRHGARQEVPRRRARGSSWWIGSDTSGALGTANTPRPSPRRRWRRRSTRSGRNGPFHHRDTETRRRERVGFSVCTLSAPGRKFGDVLSPVRPGALP